MKIPEILNYIRAGEPCLALNTKEVHRTLKALRGLLDSPIGGKQICYNLKAWSLADNKITDLKTGQEDEFPLNAKMTAQVWPVQYLCGQPNYTILLAPFLYEHLKIPAVMAALVSAISLWENRGIHLIVLGNIENLRPELQALIRQVEIDLPTVDEVNQNLHQSFPEEEIDASLSVATKGLTLFEVRNLVSRALVRNGRVTIEDIWEGKQQILEEAQGLSLLRTELSLDDLVGLDEAVDYVARCHKSPYFKGIALIGVQGTGKTHFVSTIGKALGMETLVVRWGSIFGSYVGQTEKQVRTILKTIDAVGPCFLQFDEFEKQLTGSQSSGQTDSGVTARATGELLQWLDKPREAKVFVTMNDPTKIDRSLIRAGRFNTLFAVGFPNDAERKALHDLYRTKYGVPETTELPDTTRWTGAEIQSLYEHCAMGGYTPRQAAGFVPLVTRSMKEQVEAIEEWTRANCRAASRPIPESTKRSLVK